jgi:uncharacterized protein YjlB
VNHDDIFNEIIEENGLFPNNPRLPLLIYKSCFLNTPADAIEDIFLSNGWKNSWINGIYPFHHYHSNTHEVLGVASGMCSVQIGGEGGKVFEIEAGDVLILPAGVSHKKISCSSDFQVVGAYPHETQYDMCYGSEKEQSFALDSIKNSLLPKTDPVFGSKGPLFQFWK